MVKFKFVEFSDDTFLAKNTGDENWPSGGLHFEFALLQVFPMRPFLRCYIGVLDCGNCIELDSWKNFLAFCFVVNSSVFLAIATTCRFVLS